MIETIKKQEKQRKQGGGKGKIEPRWKPGESGNPKGRPKGVPNRSTVARLVLGMAGELPEEVLKNLKLMYPKFFEKKSKKWSNEFLMTIRLAQKAIIKADVASYNAIMDSAYGKAIQALKHGGDEDSPLYLINLLREARKLDDNKQPKTGASEADQ